VKRLLIAVDSGEWLGKALVALASANKDWDEVVARQVPYCDTPAVLPEIEPAELNAGASFVLQAVFLTAHRSLMPPGGISQHRGMSNG